jgi:hypothetical protein
MTVPVKKYTVGKHTVQLIVEDGTWVVYLDFKVTTLSYDKACAKAWAMSAIDDGYKS